MDESWIINHLGEDRSTPHASVAPPLVRSNNFSFPTLAALREAVQNEFDAPFYTRGFNPTVAQLREKLAALDNTEDALVFSSGAGAMTAAVMAFTRAGDHIVCVQKPYSWTKKLLVDLLARFGVEHSFVDGRDAENYRRACKSNTKLFILESPNSLTFEITDIAAVARIAREKGVLTICDNSHSGPLFQRPIDLGVDMNMYTASKYINGHADVVAGVITGRKEHVRKIMAHEFMTLGAVVSPADAWLMLRSLRTLHLRMDRSAGSALNVATFLSSHPKVAEVLWPFAPGHPQGDLARRQMNHCGALMSIRLNVRDESGVERFCNALKYFLMAVSWGGYESLAFPTCALKGPSGYYPDLPWDLVRLYIGLEDPDALIADLAQALDSI
jgi:cystathionine beta-lyase/cystathionine gamma-synthase